MQIIRRRKEPTDISPDKTKMLVIHKHRKSDIPEPDCSTEQEDSPLDSVPMTETVSGEETVDTTVPEEPSFEPAFEPMQAEESRSEVGEVPGSVELPVQEVDESTGASGIGPGMHDGSFDQPHAEGQTKANEKKPMTTAEKRERRRRRSLKVAIVAFVFAFLIELFCIYEIRVGSSYQTVFYSVTSNNLKSRVRIVFISDLHNHVYGNDNDVLVQDIRALKPDLILLGGDLMTRGGGDYSYSVAFCAAISDIAPVYGVLGNHESEAIYHDGDVNLLNSYTSAGVTFLRNQTIDLEINQNRIELVGLEGADYDFGKYGASDCIDGLGHEGGSFRIILYHAPVLFRDALADVAFDLGLAGHVHGGIVNVPRLGPLYSAEEGFLPDMAHGEVYVGDKPVIISAGLGDSSWVPRMNNPHELVVIDANLF